MQCKDLKKNNFYNVMASTDWIENPFTFMEVQHKNTNEIAKAKIKAKQKSYYPCM